MDHSLGDTSSVPRNTSKIPGGFERGSLKHLRSFKKGLSASDEAAKQAKHDIIAKQAKHIDPSIKPPLVSRPPYHVQIHVPDIAQKREGGEIDKTTKHVHERHFSAGVEANRREFLRKVCTECMARLELSCGSESRIPQYFRELSQDLRQFIAQLEPEEVLRLTSDIEGLLELRGEIEVEDIEEVLFRAVKDNNSAFVQFLCIAGRESLAVEKALQVRAPRTLLIEALLGDPRVPKRVDQDTLKIVQALLEFSSKFTPKLIHIKHTQQGHANGYTPIMLAVSCKPVSKKVGLDLISSLVAAGANSSDTVEGVGVSSLAEKYDNGYMLKKLKSEHTVSVHIPKEPSPTHIPKEPSPTKRVVKEPSPTHISKGSSRTRHIEKAIIQEQDVESRPPLKSRSHYVELFIEAPPSPEALQARSTSFSPSTSIHVRQPCSPESLKTLREECFRLERLYLPDLDKSEQGLSEEIKAFIEGLHQEEALGLIEDIRKIKKDNINEIVSKAVRNDNVLFVKFLCVAGFEYAALGVALQVKPQTLLIEAFLGEPGVQKIINKDTLKIVQALLQFNPTLVNIPNPKKGSTEGYTPIMLAASSRFTSKNVGLKLVDSLIAAGASVTSPKENLVGPTVLAVENKNSYMLMSLLEAAGKIRRRKT